MVLLDPNSFKKKTPLPGSYPAPPAAAMSSAAVPPPTPPQIAPPPPATQGYGVSGPPGAGIAPPTPAPGAPPTPYAATGVKGAPIPGMTTNAAPNGAPDVSAGPAPAAPPSLGGDENSYLAFIKAHPENFDTSISDDQWKAWKGYLDPSCPSTKPFKTERPGPGGSNFSGPEKCVEKPDTCPEGYHVVGNDSKGVAGCQPDGAAGGAGGAPGGPGGAGGGPGGSGGAGGYGGGYGVPGAGGDVNDILGKIISGDLNNPVSRYTPEAMATLLSGTKATAEDQSQQERDAINEDAAARGVLGAGATGTALANSRIAANRTVAGEQQNIARAKIDADFQDKQSAIQNAQKYLDAARDWAYKQQMTQMQRQQFDANLALAYARMQQDWDQLQASYGYQALLGGT